MWGLPALRGARLRFVQSFAAHTPLHALVLATIATVTALAVVVRRRRPPWPLTPGRFERAIGGGYLLLWIGTFTWLLFPPQHDPPTTYPLQLCHWAAAIAALALLTGHRLWQTLAYFWGLALCTQALATPNLSEGPAQWPFWFFWATHAMIVGVPVYEVCARGYRPAWRDFRIACLLALGYVAVVLPIDLATGWNYGFVGSGTPGVPSIVDLLGPWPQRLAPIAGIAFVAMAALMLPWHFVRRGPPTS